MVTTVYCDDAGFTGDNLLNLDQPFFAYSAVAIEPEEAEALVCELRRSFNLKGNELKGKSLYQRNYAGDLIEFLAGTLGGRVSVALNHKLFSLCAKFFEYVYEPSIAANSRFFYERGTHIYVATVLWAYLSANDAVAHDIAARFEAIMRRRAGDPRSYFDLDMSPGEAGAIEPILRFAVARRRAAMAEIEALAGTDGHIKWVLDLSLSSARSVLATIGERVGEIDVVMDDSVPLEAFAEFLSVFVGRSETAYMELAGRRRPLSFHLNRPPRFGSSKSDQGLQVADIFASFTALAARDRHTQRGNRILQAVVPVLDADTVFPDLAALDLTRKDVVMNASLIVELADRAEEGRPILDRIEDYHGTMSYLYDADPPDFA